MAVKKVGIGVLLLGGLALWAWSKRKPAEAEAAPTLAETLAKAAIAYREQLLTAGYSADIAQYGAELVAAGYSPEVTVAAVASVVAAPEVPIPTPYPLIVQEEVILPTGQLVAVNTASTVSVSYSQPEVLAVIATMPPQQQASYYEIIQYGESTNAERAEAVRTGETLAELRERHRQAAEM